MRYAFAVTLGLTAVLAACGSSTNLEAERAALMQTSRDWAKAATTGNVDQILPYWADDAVVMPPDAPAVVGKEAIRKFIEGAMKIPGFTITWEPEQATVATSGDVGYLVEHNRWTFADSTGAIKTQYGKSVTVWRKDANGDWKCVIDTWNNSPTETVLGAK